MSNQLNMADHQAILGLARLNWSQRRVAAELGIDRQTVSRHLKAPAIHPHPPLVKFRAARRIHASAGLRVIPAIQTFRLPTWMKNKQ